MIIAIGNMIGVAHIENFEGHKRLRSQTGRLHFLDVPTCSISAACKGIFTQICSITFDTVTIPCALVVAVMLSFCSINLCPVV